LVVEPVESCGFSRINFYRKSGFEFENDTKGRGFLRLIHRQIDGEDRLFPKTTTKEKNRIRRVIPDDAQFFQASNFSISSSKLLPTKQELTPAHIPSSGLRDDTEFPKSA